MDMNEHQLPTKAICNKGFSGNSSFLPRIKFRGGGQDSSPQSSTAYSPAVVSKPKKHPNNEFLLH